MLLRNKTFGRFNIWHSLSSNFQIKTDVLSITLRKIIKHIQHCMLKFFSLELLLLTQFWSIHSSALIRCNLEKAKDNSLLNKKENNRKEKLYINVLTRLVCLNSIKKTKSPVNAKFYQVEERAPTPIFLSKENQYQNQLESCTWSTC